MRCESCGATLAPNAPECPYCQTMTAVGHAQASQHAAWEQQRAAHAAHAHHQAQMQREWHLRTRASRLPLWGLFALLVPCLGVPALIAALVAWGVRAEAKRSNLPVPGQVTTALVMSGIGFVLSIALLVVGARGNAEHEAHVEALEKGARPLLDKAAITQPEACSIAEWHVERDGYEGTSGLNIDEFRCDGRLLSTGPEKLLLEALQFKSSSKQVTVDVCFVRRARWTVDRVVPTGSGCDAPAGASGSAATTPPASSPAATTTRGRPARPGRAP
jgi:hypothetical protein